ncbi:MAG: hydrogenase 4 subunit B [Candidatus Aquicultor primus]|uniref:Hydrogenase 4 subunit B n=1 Tax=Candidatus Aquicultor primus TaxID=1797195 RepID=A0A1F2UIV9_9ACTN|nr:MAG: hydrogenase 4 subunit B [Candidatus Aquicultor primus]
MLAAHLLGIVLPLVFYHNNRINILLAYGFAALASIAGIAIAMFALTYPSTVMLTLFPSALFGDGSLSLDGLSAFFLLTISTLSLAVSIYAPPYMRKTAGERSAGGFGALYSLFVLSMILVVTVDNAFYFAIFWEMMTLTSYFLIVFDYKNIQTVKAGFQYLVMTHAGTAFILIAFITLAANSGGFGFVDFKSAATTIPPALKNAIFLAALLGFGTKAGLVPLHVWLPRAHPAAPSHVSALMSGVMIKTAIYGLIRVMFDFLSPLTWWWGAIIIILAAVSALLGVMYALMEHDIKRLLAYHSVENIGIILMGIGLAVVFMSFNLKAAALLSLTAGLFHLINHAIFKGLLFLGAGSIHYATGTKNIDDMGGLLKTMPVTGTLFLVGSLAISALPPFNGFASEWLTFQAILQSYTLGDTSIKLIALFLAPALALTGGLAAACFVKVFGIAFLSLPRSECVAGAKEVPRAMLVGMGILGVLSVALGVGATIFIKIPERVGAALLGATGVPMLSDPLSFNVAVNGSRSSVSIALIMVVLALIGILAAFLVRIRGKRSTIIGPTWDCGIREITPRMQYSATAFSRPLRMVFSGIYQPRSRVDVEDGISPYFPRTITYEASIYPVFERYIYKRIINVLVRLAGKAKMIQAGSINLYLSYIFVTLLILLIFTRG